MTVVTLASRRAAPTPTPATPQSAHELHQLHARACNALSTALHHLTGPDCSPAAWAAATARAHRALTSLHQANALIAQEGGAA